MPPNCGETYAQIGQSLLGSESASELLKTINIKGVLIGDAQQVESFLVAMFIQECETSEKSLFDAVVRIFTGVLIEDFINNIQTIGVHSYFKGLGIYYDTTVLLRLLGTSGRLLQAATMETHVALQDLGCKTLYLDYSSTEIINILSYIINALAEGGEIFGETAEALTERSISISDIKDIAATYPVRLGQLNIFPLSYNYNARKGENVYQIDEISFAKALESEAIRRDRTYKRQNAENDARAIAQVIRLRKGQTSANVSQCGHVFVSHNPLLQGVSRRFVDAHVEGYHKRVIPPVLTLGQISTIAWLSNSKALEPHKVSKELLAICYNAVRPSSHWVEEFSRALQRFEAENIGFVQERADQFLFLQAARNAARDASLGQGAVLNKMNVAEMFQRAAKESDAVAAEHQRRLEEQARHHAEMVSVREKKQAGRIAQIEERLDALAEKITRTVITVLRILAGVAFFVLLLLQASDGWQDGSWVYRTIIIILALVNMISILDLTGWKIVSQRVNALEGKIFQKIRSLLPTTSERE